MAIVKLWPPSYPTPQRDTDELLDSRTFSRAEVARSLRDVARINAFLGATAPLYQRVWSMVERSGSRAVTVLDVGAGNGDFARRLFAQGQRKGIAVQVIALDISALHLAVAREHLACQRNGSASQRELRGGQFELLQADVFALPLRDESVDVVTSSLFLHHFRPAQIEALLAECARVARVGLVMNDCARDAVALGSFRVLRPLLARSFLTRSDALASIRRAYTPDEMRGIAASLPGATVRAYFPYRLQVEWQRP